MVLMLIDFVLYWLNSIPPTTGISTTISPRTIVKGTAKPDFKHDHLSFRTYVMAYVGTKNNMKARSVPAISLAPSNGWGGHYFMSIITGKKIHAYKWTSLPINDEVIERIHELAESEDQPELINGTVFFEWGAMSTLEESSDAQEIDDELVMIDTPGGLQDDLGVIQPNTDAHTNNEMNDSDDHDSVPTLNKKNDNYEEIGINLEAEMLQNTELDDDSYDMMNEEELANNDDFFDNNEMTTNDSFMRSMEAYELQLQNEMHNVHHEIVSNNTSSHAAPSRAPSDIPSTMPTQTPSAIPSTVMETAEEEGPSVNLSGRPRRANAGAGVETFEPTLGGKEHFSYCKKCMLQRQHKASQRKPLRARITLLMREARKKAMNSKTFLQLAINTIFLSAQMNAGQGIKRYGDRAIITLIKECIQLDKGAFPGKPVVEPVFTDNLTPDERAQAMSAVAIIKGKRCGKVKGRICANGSKQKRYLQSEDTFSSPTVSNEGIMGSFMSDAYERRSIAVVDIPGAYLHARMKHDKRRVLMKLQGRFVDFMCKANNKYAQYVTYERGKKVLYLKLLRALYGCIESALLWYEPPISMLHT